MGRKKNYMNRDKKEEENNILLQKYQERYPKATKKEVSQKINVLRSNFKRELKRLNELGKSGAGVTDESYSSLWYFDALRFIEDVETPISSRSNVQEIEDEPQQKKTKKSMSATDELVYLASQRLKEKRSVFRAACDVWAVKLENMDPNQAIMAEKIINDTIYDAQLGKLGVSTTLGSRSSTPFSQFDYNPSSSNSSIDMYIRPPTSSATRQNVLYVQPPTPSPTQPNVVYVRPPMPSPSKQIFVPQPQSSSEIIEEDYIIADDASQGELQTFFSTFR